MPGGDEQGSDIPPPPIDDDAEEEEDEAEEAVGDFGRRDRGDLEDDDEDGIVAVDRGSGGIYEGEGDTEEDDMLLILLLLLLLL